MMISGLKVLAAIEGEGRTDLIGAGQREVKGLIMEAYRGDTGTPYGDL